MALSSNSTALNFSPSSIARLVPPPVLTCETASAKPSCSIAAALSPPPMMLVASLSAIKFYNVPPTYFAQTNRGHATIRVDKPLDRYYPQSNGKLERYHRSLKHECIRQKTPLNLEDAKRVTAEFVHTYNEQRLHSAIGYVTPRDMLEGRQMAIHEERDRKLEAARERRAEARAKARTESYTMSTRSEDRATLGSDPSAESMPKASALGVLASHQAPGAPNLLLATMR